MKNEYGKTIRNISSANLKKKFPGNPQIKDPAADRVSRKELEQLLNDKQANRLTIYYRCHRESTNGDRQNHYKGLHNVVLVVTKDEVNPEIQLLRTASTSYRMRN